MQDHDKYMKMAIDLAKKGQGSVSPNPMVGCIIVKNDKIIGEGYHENYGGPHAEVMALRNCVESPYESDLYVTLEPCSIYGKTPPCCEKIIQEGVKRVFVGSKDINPKINGEGISQLEKYNIEVNYEILNDECYELNKYFFKWIETKRPWIIGKVAQTKDGFMGINSTSSTWITNNESKKHYHKLRSQVDGIMIGANTAKVDNPSLTVREVSGVNPKRVILDTNRKLALDLNLFNDNLAETIVVCSKDKFVDSQTSFCKYLIAQEDNGLLNPFDVLDVLGANGLTSLIIEGGQKVLNTFFENNLIDEMYIYSSNNTIDNASLINPLIINSDWVIKDNIHLSDNNLIIARKRELCLQEL